MARVRRGRSAASASGVRSFSCADEEYAQIRDRAAAVTQSVSAYVVERALSVRLPGVVKEAGVARELVLDARAQRELHEWMGYAARHAARWSGGLAENVELVLRATMLEMLAQGRGDEMRMLLEQVLGEDRARQAAERFEHEAQDRDWLA